MRVRSAATADHDRILALPGLGPTTRRLLADDLGDARRRRVLVATAAGPTEHDPAADAAVVGVALATRQVDAAHVLDVAVADGWRRRGVATALLVRLAACTVADGTPALTLEVRAGNLAARRLYERLGFEDAGVRPGYYQDGEDAHVLWLHDVRALARRHEREPAPTDRPG